MLNEIQLKRIEDLKLAIETVRRAASEEGIEISNEVRIGKTNEVFEIAIAGTDRGDAVVFSAILPKSAVNSWIDCFSTDWNLKEDFQGKPDYLAGAGWIEV